MVFYLMDKFVPAKRYQRIEDKRIRTEERTETVPEEELQLYLKKYGEPVCVARNETLGRLLCESLGVKFTELVEAEPTPEDVILVGQITKDRVTRWVRHRFTSNAHLFSE